MRTLREILLTATAVVAIGAAPAIAQNATVHGKVINPAGQPVTDGQVKFTKDLDKPANERKFLNTVPTDAGGNYKAADVAPGDYIVIVVEQGKDVDFQKASLKAGDDKTIDFDMTRAEYINSMTPEQKKALEEYKKNAAAAIDANKKIANLNATLAAVRADLKAAQPTAGDVSKDVSDMKAAVDAKPDESILWISYANTLEAQGDHLAKADKDAHKPVTSDDEAMKSYSDAIDAYKKGAELNAASKKPVPADQAAAWNGVGNALAKQGKPADATAAFENAVKAEPTSAGMFYGNEAAVLFNAGQTDAAAAAADKAIAADPNRPDPYFIKGQALIAKSTFDAKTQKIIPPAGCVDAYQKYLQLAPDGSHAEAVKEVLTSLGEKIDTKYNARRK
ncbi:MAG TPA: carboxypeptidase-like regulatory domain-containing protein [Acidobacteriaceae bacterium]|nr:carboxypeptidase-like regulatory domain-containing protein [Acidobacteriaceae bacterium]